jgi:hypothetical protein
MGSGHDLTIMTPGSPRGEPAIRVETFGRLVIVPAGGRTAAGLPPVRSALLVFLAVERDVSREEALTLFWPESNAHQARHSLNQVLHRLRADLGAGWLQVSGDRLQATPALQADVHEFMAAIEASEPDRAIGLYRGRFLQGAHLGKHREERQVARTAAADTPWLLPSLFWELRALAGMGRFAEIRARVADAHPLPEHGIPCPDRFIVFRDDFTFTGGTGRFASATGGGTGEGRLDIKGDPRSGGLRGVRSRWPRSGRVSRSNAPAAGGSGARQIAGHPGGRRAWARS